MDKISFGVIIRAQQITIPKIENCVSSVEIPREYLTVSELDSNFVYCVVTATKGKVDEHKIEMLKTVLINNKATLTNYNNSGIFYRLEFAFPLY